MSVHSFARRPWRHAALAMLLLQGAACLGNPTSTDYQYGTSYITANVNGITLSANYNVDITIGALLENGLTVDVVGLEIGPTYSGRQIELLLRDFHGVGTYPLGVAGTGGTSGPAAYYLESPDVRAASVVRAQQDTGYTSQRAGAGSVTVTAYDPQTKRIVGTFSVEVARIGTPTDIKQITNGAFEGRLTVGG